MTKIMLDASFVLEVILKRDKYLKCLKYLESSNSQFYISIVSLHLAYHFGIKAGNSIWGITKELEKYLIISAGEKERDLALLIIQANDFEDALQISSCLNGTCRTFVTLDKKLYKRYSKLIDIDYIN